MDYLSVEEARDLGGLKLVLTGGVPGPWSEAAKALFNHHQVPFHPVLQVGGQSNDALVAWTVIAMHPSQSGMMKRRECDQWKFSSSRSGWAAGRALSPKTGRLESVWWA